VQRVRHGRGGEYVNHTLQAFYAERGIQMEATPGHAPEANGIAERHNLRLQDIALPMLSDSADPAWGLPRLGERYAADAFVYANDIHNATPASGAVVGRTPHEGLLGRAVSLADFHRFGSRVWVHRTGHRLKLQSRALPGRFLGFERPLSRGIYRVLLDDGSNTQSQSVQCSDVGYAATSPPPQVPAVGWGEDDDEDSSDDDDFANAPAVEPEQVTEESDDEVDLRNQRIPPSPPPPPAAPPLSAPRRSVL
jgi:hypothetical protein